MVHDRKLLTVAISACNVKKSVQTTCIPKNGPTKHIETSLAKSVVASTSLSLIQPGGTPNLPVEVLGAPQCPQPRICLCQGVHRLGDLGGAVSIFCGNLVDLYEQEMTRDVCGGCKKKHSSYDIAPFSMICRCV